MLQIVLFISLCNSYLVCCWPGVRCLSHFVHLFCTQDSRCHFYLLWCVNFPSPWTLTFVHFLTACYMLHYCSLAGEHILLLSVTWVGCWWVMELTICFQAAVITVANKSLISVIISWLLGWQVLPDQLAAVIWSLWKPTLPNIRILFA